MSRRLRLVGVQVTPVLVWDDGDTLSPGPDARPRVVSAADLDGFPDALRAELDTLNEASDKPAT